MLVREGLIYRQRGRGSFVAHPTVEQVLQRLVSFTDDMRQRGFAPSTRTLSAGLLPAPEDIAGQLLVQPGEELARIERLRLADGEPMSVEESYLIHRHVPGILEKDFVTSPLREVIDRNYNIRWERARQVIRAINATRALAETLSVRPNAALLFIERVSYSQQGVPVEFLRVYHRGDRYALAQRVAGVTRDGDAETRDAESRDTEMRESGCGGWALHAPRSTLHAPRHTPHEESLMDLICLGELLIDMFPAELGRPHAEVSAFRPVPGGAPANAAVAARRLGAEAAFIGKVGDDPFGHYLVDVLARERRGDARDAVRPGRRARR